MEISLQQLDRTSIVSINGDLDAMTSDQVAEYLNARIGQGETQLVLDLSRVNFMSSAGLRVILGVLKETRNNDGDLYLAAVQAGVKKVLKISGFVKILKLFNSVDEAVAQFDIQ